MANWNFSTVKNAVEAAPIKTRSARIFFTLSTVTHVLHVECQLSSRQTKGAIERHQRLQFETGGYMLIRNVVPPDLMAYAVRVDAAEDGDVCDDATSSARSQPSHGTFPPPFPLYFVARGSHARRHAVAAPNPEDHTSMSLMDFLKK